MPQVGDGTVARAHAKELAALEAKQHVGQHGLQGAGVVAVRQHQAVQIELQLDRVEIRHRSGFTGFDQRSDLRVRGIGIEADATSLASSTDHSVEV